jgi:predicted permease
MSRLRTLWRALTQRRRYERELDDELAFHVAARADDLVRAGLDRAEAARRARVELGMAELHKADVRAAHGLALLDGLAGDLRHAWRALLRNPVFAGTAVLILGLAIGANAALFAFFDAYVLRAPAVRAPDRLVDIMAAYPDGEVAGLWTVEDARQFAAAGARAFEGLYLVNHVRVPLLGASPTMTYGHAVSADYFELLGARLELGRAFDAAEARDPVLVLSAAGWRRLAGGRPDVVGTTLQLGPTTYTVIGVAAEEFRGVDVVGPQFWMPRDGAGPLLGDLGSATVGGVLRAGVTPEQARAALQPVLAERAASPAPVGPTGVVVAPRRSMFDSVEAHAIELAAIPVFAGFLLVLLVASANLANLTLARAAARRRELAIRLSVGASRWRVVRHMLVESALVAALAAVLGTVACAAAVEALHDYAFGRLGPLAPDLVPAAFDARRAVYVALLALLTALAIGLAPALEASARQPGLGARDIDADGRARSGRLRDALLVSQLAASAILLVLASLIVANARRADEFRPGFDFGRVVDVAFPQPTPRLRQEVERVPGVSAATAVGRAPLYGQPYVMPVRVDGRDAGVAFNHVDERYFATLGIALRRGRSFLPGETASGARVAIVSAATARRLWPDRDPIGRVFDVEFADLPVPVGRYEVVGVADDVASGVFFAGRDRTMVYFPTALGEPTAGALLARVDGDVARALRALVDACTRADASVLCEPATLESVVASHRLPLAVAGGVASSLGFAALAISCIGLYGVVAFTVVRRTREIGVRIALGATPRAVLRFVLGGAVRRIALGLAIGLPVCLALSALVAANVAEVRAFDARSYVLTPLVLALVAVAAAFVQARRAARVAPVDALREDG